MRSLYFVALLFTAAPAAAQPLRLQERFAPDVSYHVSCRVQIDGKMTLPDKVLNVDGKSHIEYDERVLRVDNAGVVDKTLRLFSAMDFERKVGDDAQKHSLRPSVYRLVILRQNNIEAPFSPDGLLKLSEIDLIRTDVFTPALAGLLPKNPVSPGDQWKADEMATRELTDLMKISDGELTCRFDKVDRALAKISFDGKINGVGENGPTRHDLEGFFYFDIAANMLTYVSLKGTENLVDDKGNAKGTIKGTFVLTRQARTAPAAIADTKGLPLDPNEDNTRLLFEDDELGVRLAHARKWKPRVEGTQIKLEDSRGNGVVLTPDPLNRLPTLPQFIAEAKGGLERRKAKVSNVTSAETVQRQPTQVEAAALDAEVALEKSSLKLTVALALIRDQSAGATFAATLLTDDRAAMLRELEKMAASVRVSKMK